MSQENLRVQTKYENRSDQFVWTAEERQNELTRRQFFNLYQSRLNGLRNRVLEQGRDELGAEVKYTPLSQLKANVPAFVIGLTIKRCAKRPSLFAEFKEPDCEDEEALWKLEAEEAAAEQRVENEFDYVESLCGPSDTLEIEDDKQRLPLVGKQLDKDEFVTGHVLGFWGKKDANEDFVVEKVIYPKLAPQVPWPKKVPETYILFTSGVNLNAKAAKNEWKVAAFHQITNFLQGQLMTDENDIARKIARVIFAGDTVRLSSKVTKLGQVNSFEPSGIEQMDRLLQDMVATCPVDLMAGPNDVASALFPQQPMVRQAFPRCHCYPRTVFQTVTNPYAFEYDGLRFLGCSGQSLDDLHRYTRGLSTLDLMRELLERGHLCPTCPDTVDGFPCVARDPLVLQETPHVFFVANQAALETEMATLSNGQKVFLMTVPRFTQTHEVYLLNVRSLDITPFEVYVDDDLQQPDPMDTE